MNINDQQFKQFIEEYKTCDRFVSESTSLDKLAPDFIDLVIRIDIVKKEEENTHIRSKYANLVQFIKASRFQLHEFNFGISQYFHPINGKNHIGTRLLHRSGQWLKSLLIISDPPIRKDKNGNIMDDSQAIASKITFFRRYEYQAIIGMASDKEDDDAEAAMQRYESEKIEKSVITPEQVKELQDLVSGDYELMTKILKAFDIPSPIMLPQKHFDGTIKRIKELKEEKSKGATDVE